MKKSDPLQGALRGEAWLAKRVRHRLHDNQLNWLAVWVGPPGSGKSWSALRLCQLIDPTFSTERVVFDVNGILERSYEWDLPRGSAIMLDEAGLAIPNRRWYEHANEALGYLMESFRYLGLALLLTVPDPSFIDRVPRSLFNMSLDCVRVDRRREVVIARPYRHQSNPRLGKVYHKQPEIRIPGKGWVKLKTIQFSRPSQELALGYEEARRNYMTAFHTDLLQRGRELVKERLTMRERTSLVLEKVGALGEETRKELLNARGFYDADLIQVQYDTTRNVARAVAKTLSKG